MNGLTNKILAFIKNKKKQSTKSLFLLYEWFSSQTMVQGNICQWHCGWGGWFALALFVKVTRYCLLGILCSMMLLWVEEVDACWITWIRTINLLKWSPVVKPISNCLCNCLQKGNFPGWCQLEYQINYNGGNWSSISNMKLGLNHLSPRKWRGWT